MKQAQIASHSNSVWTKRDPSTGDIQEAKRTGAKPGLGW